MNSFVENLKKIDWTKNIIYFIFFLLFCVTLILWLLVPQIEQFKKQNIDYRKAEYFKKQTKEGYDVVLSQLKELQQENRKVLSAYDKSIDSEMLKSRFGEYFAKIDVKKLKEQNGTKFFSSTLYFADTSIDDMSLFYQFLSSLNTQNIVIKAEFPLEFTSNSEGVEATMNLNIYNLREERP